MKFFPIAAILAAAASSALAAVNGRCSNDADQGTCICVHTSTCKKYKNYYIDPGTKAGGYKCPYDVPDVQGCSVSPCKGTNQNSYCAFTDICNKYGTPIPGNLCPGGSNFICCNLPQ